MKYERIEGATPSGGDYSEIYYFDSDNKPADESVASKCVIRECRADGDLVNEIWGSCN